MTGLKKMLVKEQNRLENIVAVMKNQLETAPEGSMRLSTSKNKISYYHYQVPCKSGGTYISRKNEVLIQKLAQKSYNEKVLSYAEKRLRYVRQLADIYEDSGIEEIFCKEHPARKKWISPIEPTWEQRVAEWSNEQYQGKGFKETDPVIYTERGERVRSKSEKIIADYFYSHNIPYKYEHPLYLEGFGIVYPDFTVLSKQTRRELYWEHNGKMDAPGYARKAIKKQQNYEKNNIFVGEKLILTYETEQNVIQTKDIERLAKKYLL